LYIRHIYNKELNVLIELLNLYAYFETRYMIYGEHEKSGWICIIIGWLCMHTADTYLCSKNQDFCKWYNYQFFLMIDRYRCQSFKLYM